MANVTKRYFFKGPWPNFLQMNIDIGLTLPTPGFVIAFDITYDDVASPPAHVDAVMSQFGCFPDTQNTNALSVQPFVGMIAPDGHIWKLTVDNAGALSTTQVG